MIKPTKIIKIGEEILKEYIYLHAEVDEDSGTTRLDLTISGIVYSAEITDHDMDDEETIKQAWLEILEHFSVHPVLTNAELTGDKH